MSSSISNSESVADVAFNAIRLRRVPATVFIRHLWQDRTGQTLVIVAFLLSGAGWLLRGTLPEDLQNDQHYAYQKLTWRENADVVLLGDSRTWVALSPQEMSNELNDLRILNFGFGSVGYSADYLQAADRVWDRLSDRKIAVVGITPRSLRQISQDDNHFVASSRTFSLYSAWKSRWLGWAPGFWSPIDAGTMKRLMHGTKPGSARRLDDGSCQPRDEQVDHAVALNYYQNVQRDPIREEVVERLLAKVRDWTTQGIVVYGFRPPTCPAMEAMEQDFHEESFVAAFEAAGGHWLSPSQQDLQTFDGSHLDFPSARLFSIRLASLIRATEPCGAGQLIVCP